MTHCKFLNIKYDFSTNNHKGEKVMRIGILGYGNLGRGVEHAVRQNSDTELVAVFTRRDPAAVKINTPNVPVVEISEIENWKDKIDVLILCGGSATDLPVQTPEYAKLFNVIDSFDTHAKIPQHFANVDKSAKEGKKVAIISVGWDPGLFSLARVYTNAILPYGRDYTFWGKGVSQGHSRMLFVVSKVSRMPSNIQFLSQLHLKPSAVEGILNCLREKSIFVNVS